MREPKKFPLTRHSTRRWCKKINGKTYYFGPIDDPDGALKRYLSEVDRIKAGLPRTPDPDSPTLLLLVNSFLTAKLRLVECGELTKQSHEEYLRDCRRVLESLGKSRLVTELRPEDFGKLRVDLHKGVGVVTFGGRIARVRVLFKHAYDSGLIDAPLRYAASLKRPPLRAVRLAKAERGLRMLEADEIRTALLGASPVMRAAILLAVNSGFGNRDIATIKKRHINLETGWLSMPRRKTGITRRCPLWPETIEAVKNYLASRPKPKTEAEEELVFLSRYGTPLVHEKVGTSGRLVRVDRISQGFVELIKRAGVEHRGSFYLLRHSFSTIAEETGDLIATRAIMGHSDAPGDMGSQYRARITDERLRRVTDHVRAWLFGSEGSKG